MQRWDVGCRRWDKPNTSCRLFVIQLIDNLPAMCRAPLYLNADFLPRCFRALEAPPVRLVFLILVVANVSTKPC